jgi:hypothetical protein
VTIPERLSSGQRRSLLAAVAADNTQSHGIIEQRLVDALSVLLHPDPPWLARGVGDAVNANNVSRRKCGDADFQLSTEFSVIAYEPHGGVLTDVYLRGHRRTLEVVLGRRRIEWDENVAPGLPWTVTVIYVAHSTALAGAMSDYDFTTDSTTVQFRATTYSSLISQATEMSSPADVAASIEKHLVRVMAEARTPDKARRRLLELIGG